MESKITLVPTLEELQQQILRDQNLLADLHERGECLEDCILCIQFLNESNEIYKWEIDEMFIAHNLRHREMPLYPYVATCDYCWAEAWINKNKESKSVN